MSNKITLRLDRSCRGPFEATSREPRELKLWLELSESADVGQELVLLLGRFRSLLDNNPQKFRQWAFEAVEVEGAGAVEVTLLPPAAFHEMGGRRHNEGALDNHFEILRIRVTDTLAADAIVHIRMRGMLSHHAPIEARLVAALSAAESREFDAVSQPVDLVGKPGEPVGLVARAKSAPDAAGAHSLHCHTVDALCNPVEVLDTSAGLETEPMGDGSYEDGLLKPTGDSPLRLRVHELSSGFEAETNPVQRGDFNGRRVYFGELHFHSLFSGDGDRPIEAAYAYARDVLGLDFAGVSDHTPTRFWEPTQAINEQWNDAGHFVTIPGWEWSTDTGHSNIYLRHADVDAGPAMAETADHPGSADWPEDSLVIPHHTNIRSTMKRADGTHYWEAFDWSLPNKRVRLVELLQTRGNFESDELDEDWGVVTSGIGASVQDALAMGYRIGFLGGTDNHTGFPTRDAAMGEGFTGMACVLAEELTRESLWTAMNARRCYATSGVPILAHWTINGLEMGEEGKWTGDVAFEAELHGTAPIERVEIISGGKVVWRDHTDALDVSYAETLELTDAIQPGSYFYLRLRQQDGHRAWLSPVWLD